MFRCEPMARTLESIAATRGESFYRGELAHAMVAHAKANGALHTIADFADHTRRLGRRRWRSISPATTVHEIPPNGQGIAALMALGILRAFDLASLAPDSVASQHLQIEAMKLAFADAYRYVSDPRTMEVAPAALLDPDYLASRARLIDPHARAGLRPRRAAARRHRLSLRSRRARHDRVADPVELHGIRLRRRRAGHRHQPAESRRRIFAAMPGIRTRSRGGKRPFQTIIPGFLTRDGAPLAAFGVMGGPIQPPGHVQTMVRMLIYGMNPQAALDAPRWKLEGGKVGRSRGQRFAGVARGTRSRWGTRSTRSRTPTWISARARSS